MVSGLLASSRGAFSITTGISPYWRPCMQTKLSFGTDSGFEVTTLGNKTGKIHREIFVTMSSQNNLKYHYKGIRGGSRYQESERKYIVSATSEESFENKAAQAQRPESIWESIKRGWEVFYRFNRPYAATGLAICATSASLLAVERLSDFSPAFFIGWLQVMATTFCVNTFSVGLNDLCDVKIDKINKPHHPLASGELSFASGVFIIGSAFILLSSLALTIRSWPLLLGGLASVIIAVAYSIDVPLLRWKKYPLLEALSITLYATAATPFACFFHMQTVVFNRPAKFSRQLMFSTALLTIYNVALTLLKDIPDIEGDKKFGIQSLAVRLGGERVFWISTSLLQMAYGAAIFVGITSPFLWSKIVTGIGHAILASLLWYRAKFVDIKSNASTHSFYMFIFKLLYANNFLIPLFR